jgi:hypothetical protein
MVLVNITNESRHYIDQINNINAIRYFVDVCKLLFYFARVYYFTPSSKHLLCLGEYLDLRGMK